VRSSTASEGLCGAIRGARSAPSGEMVLESVDARIAGCGIEMHSVGMGCVLFWGLCSACAIEFVERRGMELRGAWRSKARLLGAAGAAEEHYLSYNRSQ